MDYVKSLQELQVNMETLDRYLNEKIEPSYSFALERIKNGTCFVAVQKDDGYHFYPSRFIGYAANNMNAHLNNYEKDGRKTNPIISKLLGQKLEKSPFLEHAYQDYCEKLGFTPKLAGAFGVARKYWTFP